MLNLAKPTCVLLMAFPLVAAAQAVRVTTSSSGYMDPHPVVLDKIGLDFSDYSGGPLPYNLTISSIIDPKGAGVVDAGSQVLAFHNITVSFRIGASTYDYTGQGLRELAMSDANYSDEFSIGQSSRYPVTFSNSMSAPAGTFSGGPLTPRHLELGPGMTGSTQVAAYLNDPDFDYSWRMFGNVDSMSLQVSPVPEPGPLGMLLAGAFTLGLWGRYSRRTPAA